MRELRGEGVSGPEGPSGRAPSRIGDPSSAVEALARDCRLVREGPGGEPILLFEHWERLSSLLTPPRREVLRRLRDRPGANVADLAAAMGRSYGCVHEDISVLEMAGLVEGCADGLRLTADRVSVLVDV